MLLGVLASVLLAAVGVARTEEAPPGIGLAGKTFMTR